MKKCSVCEGAVLVGDLCKPCQKQKDRMEELRRQKRRDEAFGSPWDSIRERKQI